MFNNNWSKVKLDQIVKINQKSLSEGTDPHYSFHYIDISAVDRGKIVFPAFKIRFKDAPSRARRIVQNNDILMATVRPNLQSFAYLTGDLKNVIVSTGFAVLSTTHEANPQFIYQFLFSDNISKQLNLLLVGSNYPAINASQVADLTIVLPPYEEQTKIAKILSTWDIAINQNERLIEAKAQLKRGLMQQLLTSKKRFKEFEEQKWRKYRISELFSEVKRYVSWDENSIYNLVSIRRRCGGLFSRGSLSGNQIKVKKLKSVKTDDFLISKRQVVHGAWGRVTPEFNDTKVSDEYDCLIVRNPETLDIEFFNYLAQMPFMQRYAYLACNGVHIEKLIFNLEDFWKEYIHIPPTIQEQRRIADVLNTCDKEINVLKKQLDLLKQQKRGLMQKLLTGQIRVCVDDVETAFSEAQG